eukprot:6089289-Karenia_brevis.AAC.1
MATSRELDINCTGEHWARPSRFIAGATMTKPKEKAHAKGGRAKSKNMHKQNQKPAVCRTTYYNLHRVIIIVNPGESWAIIEFVFDSLTVGCCRRPMDE